MARASHWQCEGREFESLLLHHRFYGNSLGLPFFLPFLLKIKLKTALCRAVLEPRKPPRSLKSRNPLTFSDFEGDLTPSDFELNSHSEFAKTYADHLEISANRRPLVEKNHGFFTRVDHTDIICQFAARSGHRTRGDPCRESELRWSRLARQEREDQAMRAITPEQTRKITDLARANSRSAENHTARCAGVQIHPPMVSWSFWKR